MLVKIGSWSLTMEHGMLWSLMMLSKKTLAMETAVHSYGDFSNASTRFSVK
jgi:hypothetical protein